MTTPELKTYAVRVEVTIQTMLFVDTTDAPEYGSPDEARGLTENEWLEATRHVGTVDLARQWRHSRVTGVREIQA